MDIRMLAGLIRAVPRPAVRRALPLLAASLTVAAAGLTATVHPDPAGATAPSTPSATAAGDPTRCAVPLLAGPMPLRSALPVLGDGLATAASANRVSPTTLRAGAADRDLWLDECGRRFYVDRAARNRRPGPSRPGQPVAPLAATFALESRPEASRTIFLDFSGGTVTDTAWNRSYGSRLAAEPFSTAAPADTAYSPGELMTIQQAWQVVAEDYAPFDVNVTTRDPGPAALDRVDYADLHYGVRVLITNKGTIFNRCKCAGLAYVGSFDYAAADRGYYLPAWVFARGTGPSGRAIGEAASHEAGHSLGLFHHGSWINEYYPGHGAWAPIMGASYSSPVSQWSHGEFPGAVNGKQDDVATIGALIPRVPDDHGDTPAQATTLTAGSTVEGLISTRVDLDTFRFTGSGSTTVSVVPTSAQPNLDVLLRITDATGTVVATVDPRVRRRSATTAAGLDARWSGVLPGPGTYFATVDGTGSGNPKVRGRYSDYGSLGHYAITLGTGR